MNASDINRVACVRPSPIPALKKITLHLIAAGAQPQSTSRRVMNFSFSEVRQGFGATTLPSRTDLKFQLAICHS